MIFMVIGAVLSGWLWRRRAGALCGAVVGIIPALVVGFFLPTTHVDEAIFPMRHAERKMLFTYAGDGPGCTFYYDDAYGCSREGHFIVGTNAVKFYDGSDWLMVRKRQHLRCSLLWIVGMRIGLAQHEYMVPRSAEKWVLTGK